VFAAIRIADPLGQTRIARTLTTPATAMTGAIKLQWDSIFRRRIGLTAPRPGEGLSASPHWAVADCKRGSSGTGFPAAALAETTLFSSPSRGDCRFPVDAAMTHPVAPTLLILR
jgi:hypothetical protein